jgi:nucleoid-associated protein YgaU
LADENARLKSRIDGSTDATAVSTTVSSPKPASPGTITVTPRQSGVNATLVTTVTPAQRINLTPNDPTPRVDPTATRFHVVSGGDTLAKISTQYYGTPGRWGDILAANRDVLGEGNNLVVGRTLRIP